MTAKKTAAPQRTAAKKTATKAVPQTTTTDSDAVPTSSAPPAPIVTTADPSGAQPEDSKSSTSIAQDILNGSTRWGTGRDRVALLKKAGHDPDEVLKEYSRLRGKARRDAQR